MTGFVTVLRGSEDKKHIPTQRLVDSGIIVPSKRVSGWGLDKSEVPLGYNLFTESGRSNMAYLFGGRSPISNFFAQKFSVGTGTTAPKVTDVSLEAPVYFDPPTNSVTTKLIDSVDFPAPFIARVEFTLGVSDAVGYLVTELGLFSGNETMFARKTCVGINKPSGVSLTLLWRIRF